MFKEFTSLGTNTRKILTLLAAVTAVILPSVPGYSAVTVYYDEATWMAAAGPLTLNETFDEMSIGNLGSLMGGEFTFDDIEAGYKPLVVNATAYGAYGNTNPNVFTNFSNPNPSVATSLKMHSVTGLTAFGYWAGGGDRDQHIVKIFDKNGVEIPSNISVTAGRNTSAFLGFTSTTPVHMIMFSQGSSGNKYLGFDDFKGAIVPEPGSIVALGTGLVSIAGIIRRKRK